MVLSRTQMNWLLPVGEVSLTRVKEFKYLRVLFTSEGIVECEVDRRIWAAAVMLQLHCSDEEGGEAEGKALNPPVTLGSCPSPVVTDTSCWSELSVRESHEPLLLSRERSRLRWFRHLIGTVTRAPTCSWLVQLGGDLGEGPVPGRGIPSPLWPGRPPSQSAHVAGEREVWGCLSELLPLWHHLGWEEGQSNDVY